MGGRRLPRHRPGADPAHDRELAERPDLATDAEESLHHSRAPSRGLYRRVAELRSGTLNTRFAARGPELNGRMTRVARICSERVERSSRKYKEKVFVGVEERYMRVKQI